MDKIQKKAGTEVIGETNQGNLADSSISRWRFHPLSVLVFLMAFLFFSFGNHLLPITDPVESNYALTAKEMVQSGDWLSPQIYHQYWFDKPIMIYWLIALSYKVFGFVDFVARLPGALFGALSVAMIYQEMRVVSNRRLLSLWSALILGTSLEFWIVAHGIITDMILLFTTVGTMAYAYRGLINKNPWLVALAYGFAALGTLTKGPVALVLPGILLLIFAGSMKSWDYAKRLFPWQGLLLFILIAGPWYYFMYEAHGWAFIEGFLGLHNVTRATIAEHPEDNYFWYYLAIFPLASLPWTGVILYGMIKGWQKGDFATRPFYLYLMIWGWGTILFYTVMATKYLTYTFISLIPFSILGAMGTIELLHKSRKGKTVFILVGPAIFLWTLFFGASFSVKWGYWYLLYALVVIGIGSVLFLHRRRKLCVLPAVIGLVTMLISCVIIYEGLVPLIEQRSALRLTPVVETFEGDIYYLGGYDTSLVYYSDKPVTLVYGANPMHRDPAWSGKYTMPKVEPKEVSEAISQGKKVMLIVPVKEDKNLDSYGLADNLTKVVTVGKETIYVSPNAADNLRSSLSKEYLETDGK